MGMTFIPPICRGILHYSVSGNDLFHCIKPDTINDFHFHPPSPVNPNQAPLTPIPPNRIHIQPLASLPNGLNASWFHHQSNKSSSYFLLPINMSLFIFLIMNFNFKTTDITSEVRTLAGLKENPA